MVGYVPTQFDADDDDEDNDGDGIGVLRYGADVLFHFMPDSKFDPFIAAGYGRSQIDYPDEDSNCCSGLFDYGLGANYFLTDAIALRGDVRHDLVFDDDDTLNNFEFTGGITILFGGEKQKVVAKAPAPAPAPRPAAPAPMPAPAPAVKEVVVVLSDVHFDHDKSTLTPEAIRILNQNILVLKENPNTKIRIEGNTSASGTDEYNQKLSERRAATVMSYLTKEGSIDPKRLTKIGYGEKKLQLAEPNPKQIESPAAKVNRRVIFEIIVK
jgi:OOP family OmpA-OmpF porin